MNLTHSIPDVHAFDLVLAVVIAIVFVVLSSLLKEPARKRFNAVMIAGAGAAYLSGGGFGGWEMAFNALLTYFAYRGLNSYRFIGAAWLLHTGWDVLHHFYGNPIVPFMAASSAGCAVTDTLLAVWFFANAPSVFELRMKPADAR
jgi:hypothetical protein